MDADRSLQSYTAARLTRDAEFWLRRQGLPYFVAPRARRTLLVARTGPFFTVLLALDAARWVLRSVDVTVDGSPGAVVGLAALAVTALFALVVVPIGLIALSPAAISAVPRRMTVVSATLLGAYLVVDPLLQHAAGQTYRLEALLAAAFAALASLLATGLGVGAVALWAIRVAGRQLRALREVSGRVLPLLMLVVGLALLAPGLWQVTSTLTPLRLAAVIVLFGVLGQWFIAPVIQSEAAAIAEQNTGSGSPALSRGERANLTIVLVLAQSFQVAIFSALVAVILVVFGELALTPAVIAAWSGGRTQPVQLFGLTLPVDTALVKTSVFLSCFASLNFVVNIRSNAAYKSAFYDPLFDDARIALNVRSAYRTATAAARRPDKRS
ncbi:hypothetical protein GCM10011399_23630 [Subtercola lobariae]|uniref:Integral membrane protein n=2 Tax=Subtercola lobariae TaxID=1588641 RepID=A0A917EXR2_9MICO|nr:hypothetical protein GCM10011399_23630 [Subtercola lobariae]